MSLIFITGGARSGKSTLAVELAKKYNGKVTFIATAQAGDDEMKKRISLHKQERPQEWTTIEEPIDVASAIDSAVGYDIIIIDCITLLVSNLLCKNENMDETQWIFEKINDLVYSAKRFDGTVIIISNEVGMGIVPENKLARDFRDIAGKANQIIAGSADKVYVCFSGIPLLIKGTGD
ncbi:TPA: bifunctional adenosylcobinamide kinase/adenosylcobinamide-phosphate guanylyltransferase [bacterium]|nr:bifunctional adenosylcobinamide kinase/adenosylcobinamide-phosphate guanylyltransferase [bacterium]